jgi:phosphatidylglycerol:prolipoprotein diacylglycerol transferase
MLGLSIVVGWYLTLGLAKRDGLPQEDMANCYVFTALMAIIGSRVLYVVTNLDEFHSLGDMFALRRGGLVAYGGFLGGFVGSWLFLKRKKLPLLPWADVAVPSLATGLMLTRIGCYLFGCDFGKQLSDTAPGFLKRLGTFPHWPEGTLDKGTGSPAWFAHYEKHLVSLDSASSLPVHPTQLYESLVGLTLFGVVMFQRRHQTFRGQVFLMFTFSYGFLRYCLEMIRDDAERGEYGPRLTEHLIVPGGLILMGLGWALFMSKAVQNQVVRGVSQFLAFVPGVAAFLVLKRPNFDEHVVQLSTSQWVALITGVAAAIAYGTFWDAAKAHPRRAMALGIEEPAAPAPIDDSADEEDAPKPKKKRKKRRAQESSATGEGGESAENRPANGESAGVTDDGDEKKLEPA